MSKLQLKTYGSGKKALLCVPGWTHPIEKESLFLELLSKKFTVISVLLPGYGEKPIFSFVGLTGLEPATSRTPCAHSSHLSYSPNFC